jgi:hypothetical protein
MSKILLPALLLPLSVSLAFVGCSKGSLQSVSAMFSDADLGRPDGGLIEPQQEFLSLLDEQGRPLEAELRSEAVVVTNVEANESFEVPAGTPVSVIAKNGEHLRVVTVATGAQVSGDVIEGFVAASAVVILPPQANPPGAGGGPQPVHPPRPDVKPPQGGGVVVHPPLVVDPGGGGSNGGVGGHPPVVVPPVSVTARCENARFRVERSELDREFMCVAGQAPKHCLVPGEVLRRPEGAGQNAAFEIQGNATEWQVHVTAEAMIRTPSMLAKGGNVTREPLHHTVTLQNIKSSKKDPSKKIIPLSDILDDNSFAFGTRTFEFVPLDAEGKPGVACVVKMQAISPVVLDLAGLGRFDGLELGESNVRYDLKGDGHKLVTGWVKPTMGLLALDRNGNGRIDSGAELFGEHSAGHVYRNGYQALAALDANADGMISAVDTQFGKLVVWQDANANGVSEPGELKPLGFYGITAVSVQYGPSHRHGSPSLGRNDVRYESRFFGPKACGADGCLSFDVFFATANPFLAAK